MSLEGEAIRNEKVKVLQSMSNINLEDVALGQYRGRCVHTRACTVCVCVFLPTIYFICNEKVKELQSMSNINLEDEALGQYRGRCVHT